MPHKRKDLKIKGPNLWYLVGLITSDGCLSSDGRHIDITSEYRSFLRELAAKLKLPCKVCIKNRGTNKEAYRIQIANKKFYEFLLSIGLMPKKSLILKQVKVPEIFFFDFLRGLIDGDGGIQRWIHHTNKREQWNLRLRSGSKKFLEWLQNRIGKIIRVKGGFYTQSHTQFILKYGKMAAREIAKRCYYKHALGLGRKTVLAQKCINSYWGWKRSKTVLN